MSHHRTLAPVSEVEYWSIQVRHAEFKYELAKRQCSRVQELLDTNQKCTKMLIEKIAKDDMKGAFDMLVNMNYHLTNMVESMDKGTTMSRDTACQIAVTVGDLTSKDKKWGEPRTREMHKFDTLMSTHHQMYCKHWWPKRETFVNCYKNEKPDTS
ncbi:MAG: hypothetical protein ACPG2Y_03150 [Acholeplasmataceae bacterium]